MFCCGFFLFYRADNRHRQQIIMVRLLGRSEFLRFGDGDRALDDSECAMHRPPRCIHKRAYERYVFFPLPFVCHLLTSGIRRPVFRDDLVLLQFYCDDCSGNVERARRPDIDILSSGGQFNVIAYVTCGGSFSGITCCCFIVSWNVALFWAERKKMI